MMENMVKLKIVTDLDCKIYIDGNFVAEAQKNNVEIIDLEKGEYWLQSICSANANYKIEQILNLENHKVLRLNYSELIHSNLEFAKDKEFKFCKDTRAYYHILTGESIFNINYDWGSDFRDGYAKVYSDNSGVRKYGIINRKGDEIVPCEYNKIHHKRNSIIVQKHNKYGILSVSGDEVCPLIYDGYYSFGEYSAFKKDGKWGLVDNNGRILHSFIFDEWDSLNNGYFMVKRDKYGIIYERESRLIEATGYLYDTYYCCQRSSNIIVKKGDKWGIVNLNGEEVIPIVYDDCKIISGLTTYIAFMRDGRWVIFDEYLKREFLYDDLVQPELSSTSVRESADTLQLSTFAVFRLGDKWGIISGQVYDIKPMYDNWSDYFIDCNGRKLLLVNKSSKYGLVNCSNGKEFIPCINDNFKRGEGYYPDHFFAKHGCTWLKINLQNGEAANLCGDILFQFSDTGFTKSDRIVCPTINGKYGLLDLEGNELLPFIYEEIDLFCSPLVSIKKNDKWCIILDDDIIKGNYALSFNYDEIIALGTEGYAVKMNNKWGIVYYYYGIERIPFIYSEIYIKHIYKNSIYVGDVIFVKKDDKWGLIDIRGNEIVSLEYDELKDLGDNVAARTMDKWGLFNIKGEKVKPFIFDSWSDI